MAYYAKSIEKVTQKYVASIFEKNTILAKNFVKRLYNPRNVTYKSTALVYFHTNITRRATRIGEQKERRWPEN